MKKTPKSITVDGEVMTLRPWSELRSRLLADPEVKKAYDALEWKYQLYGALIEARQEKGYSQASLAKKIGTKQSAISRFESGQYNPTVEFVQKLSEALGLRFSIVVRK